MANDAIAEWIEGRVKSGNEKGFKIEGREEWLNISRYADPAPIVPGKGINVRIGLDKSGYVRAVQPASGQPAAPQAAAQPVVQQAPAQPAAASPNSEVFEARDQRIARQAVLNTATAILGSGGRYVDPSEVLVLAEQFHLWVNGGKAKAEVLRRFAPPAPVPVDPDVDPWAGMEEPD